MLLQGTNTAAGKMQYKRANVACSKLHCGSDTHIYKLAHTLTHSVTHSLTHTLARSLTHTLTRRLSTHTCTNTHTYLDD